MKKILFVVILLIQGFYIMAQTPTPTMTATPLPISWQQLNSYSGGTDARSRVGGCYYNNNLWIVGGINTQAGGYVDYVSTNSGLTWTAVTNNLQPLTNEALLSYNGYMYVIGGESGGNNLHGPGNNLADSPYVYQSIDGANWMTVTAGAPFYGSIASTGIVFNNKMWIIAGSNDFCFSCGGDGPAPGSCNTGSWWSTDGLDWNLATGNAQFEPRAEAVGLVYNNQMWIMGGTDGTIYYDDVWNSNDGITWNMVTGTSQTGMGDAFLGFVINNIMYVYVENYSSLPAKLWSSTDGITWTQYAACPLVPPNRREATGIFTGTNFVMAGGYRNVAKVDEVWNLGPAFGCVATPTPGFYIGSVFNIQITCTPSGSIFLGVPINSVDGAEFGYAVATPVWNSHTTGAYNWTSATNINFSYHFMTASASNNPFYTQLIDNCATNANPVYYGWINSAIVTPTFTTTPIVAFTKTSTNTPTYTPTRGSLVTKTVTPTYSSTVTNTPTFTNTRTSTVTPILTSTPTIDLTPQFFYNDAAIIFNNNIFITSATGVWTMPNLFGSATVGMAFLRDGPSGAFEATLAADTKTVTITVQAVDGSAVDCSTYSAEVGVTLYQRKSSAPWQ